MTLATDKRIRQSMPIEQPAVPKKETYWQFLQRTAREVATWPDWKLGNTHVRKERQKRDAR